jgi:hypothetical protein
MKAMGAQQPDRRRAQRGSVLSGVLIITAFLAIIAGALMTELTTNLLISRVLVHRVTNEATVKSAAELAIDQLQNAPIGQACPVLSPVIVNGQTAAASDLSCSLTVDSGSSRYKRVGGSSAFVVNAAHVALGSPWSVDEYLVADSTNLYEFPFGSSSRSWRFGIGGAPTGPVTAIPDITRGAPYLLDLLPTTSNCGGSPYCVAVLTEQAGNKPSTQCVMPSGGAVTSSPVQGSNHPEAVFFGDATGNVYAFSPDATGNPNCNAVDEPSTVPGGRPIVAGPFVFPGSAGADELYVISSDGSSSSLVGYGYAGSSLTQKGIWALPYPSVTGATAQGRALAISYAGGAVSLAQTIASFGTPTIVSRQLATTFQAAPGWCSCPGGTLIGVGGLSGAFYVLDTGLTVRASFTGGPSIGTIPVADAAGDWFYGATDGDLYELTQPTGQAALIQAGGFGALDGATGTSPIAAPCANGFCVYWATQGGGAYLTTLDAHSVSLTACITSSAICSGGNPRLWASVVVGPLGSPTKVAVTGWSYYSP